MKTVCASPPPSVLSRTTDSSFHGSIPPAEKQTCNFKTFERSQCSLWPSLTVDVENPLCVRFVSSIESVCEGDAPRQGMLGNAKRHGADFSLELQGNHPRERTSGILTCLVCARTHTHTQKTDVRGTRLCVAAHVSFFRCVRIVQKPNSVQVW